MKRLFNKICRAVSVHLLMPLVNFFNRRAYVQYRPDGCTHGFKKQVQLQMRWEKGRHGNMRGDYARLYFFMQNIEMLEKNKVKGAFAELGVYKGNTAELFLDLAPQRELYLFDTFKGFIGKDIAADVTGSREGDYYCSLEKVAARLGKDQRIHYIKGVFPETAKNLPPDICFALAHLDCDFYEPTKRALEFFYPRLSPEGIIVVHDYMSSWEGVTRAVDEYLMNKPCRLIRIPDKSGTAVMRKNAVART